jgi:hypothetical protein
MPNGVDFLPLAMAHGVIPKFPDTWAAWQVVTKTCLIARLLASSAKNGVRSHHFLTTTPDPFFFPVFPLRV